MLTAFGWVLFGMAVWGLCIMMQALEKRFAPELGTFDDGVAPKPPAQPLGGGRERDRDREVEELKRRIETLEAIVTDRRYQWEREFERSD